MAALGDGGVVAERDRRAASAPVARRAPAAAAPRRRRRQGLHRLAVTEPAQVVAQRVGARVADGGVLREQLGDDRLEGARDVGDDLVERLRRVVHLLVGDGDRVLAGERRPPGHHLVHHDAERVQVAARVGLRALRLLGREVRGGTHHRADLGEVGLGRRVHRPGDAEVGDLHLAVGADQDVRRLDVAVDEAGLVGEAERGRHLARDLGGLHRRDVPLVRRMSASVRPCTYSMA